MYNTISVVHAEIPISYYTINSNNDYLNMTIDSVDMTFTLTHGNYNASSFKVLLLSLLPTGFTMSLNSNTGIFTLSYTTNFTINSSSTCFFSVRFKLITMQN
jgi:hypothetical protein